MARKWLDEDIEVLKKMFNDKPQEDIIDAMRIKRNWTAISKKASSLGIRRDWKKVRKPTQAWNKFTLEDARKVFESHGLELLETKYVDSKTPMKFKCKCGRIDYQDINHLDRRNMCVECSKEKRFKPILNKAIKFLNKHGFELLDVESVKDLSTERLSLLCPCGNKIRKYYYLLKYNPKCTCDSKNIPKNHVTHIYSKKELVDVFWKFYEDNKRYLTVADLNKSDNNLPSEAPYYRHWGTFSNFLDDIGVLGDEGWYKHDEEVVKRLYSDSSIEEINKHLMIKRSESTIQHKANSMGVHRSYEFTYGMTYVSDDELLEKIRRYYESKGKTPSANDIDNGKFVNIYNSRFGGFNKALEMVSVPIVKPSGEVVVDEEEFKEDYENGLTYDELVEKHNLWGKSSVTTILRRLGIRRTRRWTEEQIEELIQIYPDADWDYMQERFHPFDMEAILTKASDLGLARSNFNQFSFISKRKYKSKNGDPCRSYREMIITNLLIDNDIEYEMGVRYRDLINDISVGLIVTDWVINNNIIVEYFGINGISEYDEKTKRKINIAQSHNVPLIDLFPEDLEDGFAGLIGKFGKYGINISVEGVSYVK